jgi:hypothetical protein
MMDKNDTEKTVEDESCLKVSDSVTFLASEKHGMTSTLLSFGLFLVALVSIVLVGGKNTVMTIISGIVAFGSIGVAYYKVFRPVGERGKLAEKILERIMSSELKDESIIREEWEEGLAALKRARHRRGSSDK